MPQTDLGRGHSAAEPQPNPQRILQEATEKTFPRISRMNADETILHGPVSATISEIRGKFRDQPFEQKVTKRTKGVT